MRLKLRQRVEWGRVSTKDVQIERFRGSRRVYDGTRETHKFEKLEDMVGSAHTPEEITEATFRCIRSNPMTSGVGRRIAVPGTKVAERGMLTDVANANMVAIYRLATGLDYKLNCSANTAFTAAAMKEQRAMPILVGEVLWASPTGGCSWKLSGGRELSSGVQKFR